MRWWRDLPIKRKLRLMMTLTSSVTLLVACAAFVIYEWRHFRESTEHDLAALAEIVAANSTAALSFNDQAAARDILASLRDKPHIVGAWVLDTEGKLFAGYLREGAASHSILEWKPAGMVEGSVFHQGSLCWYRRIRFNGEILGTVAIESDMAEMNSRLMEYARIVFVVLVGSLAAAFLLASRLQRFISEPILDLAETVRLVTAAKDYDVRVKQRYGQDETGLLIDGFNEMLEQIHQRDEILQQRNQELEAEITWRNRYENMLRESEERYRAFVTQSSEAIWRLEFEHPVPTTLPANEQIELLYQSGWLAEGNDALAAGYDYEDAQAMIGLRLGDLIVRDDERNLEFLRAFISSDYRLVDTESVERDREGRLRYILNNLIGVIENGCLVRAWGTQRDVTERKQAEVALRLSESKYRSLFNQIADPIFIFDRETHRFLDFNETMLRMYEYSADELRALTPFALHPPEEPGTVADRIELINSDQPNTYTHLTKSGQRMCVEILSNEVEYQGRQAIISIVRNITERKEAEEKLLSFTEQLKASNRELEDFASVASHDLQEPLRKVQAFGDRLRAKSFAQLGEEGRDYLTRMQKAAGRMQTLINDLLTFSRVTTRAQPFRPVELTGVVREVLSDLEVRLEQSRGRVEYDALPVIDADPTQMQQLLQNLISNALKFHRPDVPPVVTLAARIIAQPVVTPGAAWRPRTGDLHEGGWLELTVADNGIGFDEKYLDRIFTIFQRLQGREQYEGTGVGLAVCRKIAERHGGLITARAQPGEGATFIVTLPVRQARAASEQHALVAGH
jgi:PAS domain S-box-containing protein